MNVFVGTTLDKSTRWHDMHEKFANVTDKLGMPIDAGIRDTVVVLNLLGFATLQSCEGHIDHARYAPWITLTNQKAQELHNELLEVQRQKQKGSYELSMRLQHDIDHLFIPDQARLLSYLESFYQTRTTPIDSRLILYARQSVSCTLECQGTKLQIIRTDQERVHCLALYQQEMQAFTDFLKQRYFEDETTNTWTA